jgi:hypothetical protein
MNINFKKDWNEVVGEFILCKGQFCLGLHFMDELVLGWSLKLGLYFYNGKIG